MFERFKKSHRDDQGASPVATREREARADDAAMDDREGAVATGATTTDDRFERRTPGERDRDVLAADSDADRSGEVHSAHDRDLGGGHDRDDDGVRDDHEAMLDRDAARHDLARDDAGTGAPPTPGERDRGVAAAESDTDRSGAVHDGMADRDLDRDRGFDRDRDDGVRDDREHGGRGGMATAAGAGAAGMAAGAAARGRTDADRDRDLDRDRDFDRDDDRTIARDRDLGRDRDLDRDDRTVDREFIDEPERAAPVMGTDALETMRARQRDRFGGIQWGSDFFGWLCAIGLASLLTAILVGAGVALGVSTTDATDAAANSDTAQTIGLGGGIALLAVLAIAWFCGGYVAGRMARFDGARQGIGVWVWTILAAVIVAALAAIGGSEYDIFQRLNLPRIAVGDSTLTAGGAIAGAAAIVVTLLSAVIGGKVGERYHKRVDRVATHEYLAER
jgi:hypothetical protein